MNEKLNIQDLIDMLAARHDMDKKDADSFVKVFFQLIEEFLEKDKYVKIRGLGTFKLIDVDSRESVNINTGERIEIQGYTKVSFTPETSLKNTINRPFSCFETVVLNEGIVLEDTLLETESEEKGYSEQETIENETPVAKHSSQEEPAKEEAEVEGTTGNSMVAEAGFASPEVNSTEVNRNDTELEIKIIGEEEEEQKEDEILIVSESDLTVLEKFSVEKESVILEVPTASGEKTVLEEGIQEKEKISSVQEKEPIVSEDKTFSEEVGEVKNLEDSIVIKEEKKKTDIMSFFVGIVVSAVVLCGVTIAFVYSPDLMNKAMGKPFEDELVEVEDCDKSDSIGAYNTLTEEIILEDSQDSARDTVLEISVNASEVMEPETQVQMIVEPSVPNYDNSYEIVGTKTTYTIKEGDMLTRIALHYYGTKLLWPYIVKHNPTVIKNPNNVPCGTTIKIPKLIKKQ